MPSLTPSLTSFSSASAVPGAPLASSWQIRLAPRVRQRLQASVEQNPVTLVVGPTGCGKSTQVPVALLQDVAGGVRLEDDDEEEAEAERDRAQGAPSRRGTHQSHSSMIWCTQPRRLAVVAVATRVAQEQKTSLGGPWVGYHVGQQVRRCRRQTRLVYVTAGILLEELRRQGAAAFSPPLHDTEEDDDHDYDDNNNNIKGGRKIRHRRRVKVLIIDECHERSPESDLILAVLRAMYLQRKSSSGSASSSSSYLDQLPRLVLMSATFDQARYQRYFASIPGGDCINTITLETAEQIDSYYQQVKVSYWDQMVQQLPPDLQQRHRLLLDLIKKDPRQDLAPERSQSFLSEPLLALIRDLVAWLHPQEPLEAVWVIFAPTYRHLEQIYFSLTDLLYHSNGNHNHNNNSSSNRNATSCPWQVSVLHSSIDMEQCLRTIQAKPATVRMDATGTTTLAKRRILLASAIAESSITIPGVTVVIDLCRSLQVTWNSEVSQPTPQTVWASHSICDQRKGRTGRTCPGRVFRLIPQSFYQQHLPTHEVPQLSVSSCRDEFLKLLCAAQATTSTSSSVSNKNLSDPAALLQSCLDPPPQSVIRDAAQYLCAIGACVPGKNEKRPWRPTQAGELMAAMAFTVEDAHMILTGARLALLHEVLVWRAISSHKPAPIVHHFGHAARNEAVLRGFYPVVSLTDTTSVSLAQFAAYLFWDCFWNKARMQAALDHFCYTSDPSSRHEIKVAHQPYVNGMTNCSAPCCDVFRWTPELEEKHIQWCYRHEINPTSVRSISDLIDSSWNVFYMANFEPEWLRCTDPTPQWRQLEDASRGGSDMIIKAYGIAKGQAMVAALTAISDNPTWASEYAAMLKDPTRSANSPSQAAADSTESRDLACIPFLQGTCIYGQKCWYSHAPGARRPPCRFFRNGGCTKGDKCPYAHDRNGNGTVFPHSSRMKIDDKDSLSAIAPILLRPLDGLAWFGQHRNSLMLLGEGSFEFLGVLTKLAMRPVVSSTLHVDKNVSLRFSASDILLDVNATRIHMHAKVHQLVASGRVDAFAWNYPFNGMEEDVDGNESLVLGTFLSLAALLKSCQNSIGGPSSLLLALTLQGDQFSRWHVLRSAIQTAWRLVHWGPFQLNQFPGYSPRRAGGETFSPLNSRMYVFRLFAADMA